MCKYYLTLTVIPINFQEEFILPHGHLQQNVIFSTGKKKKKQKTMGLCNSSLLLKFQLLKMILCYFLFSSFFSAFSEKWCRLRGNLLFYFKGRDLSSGPQGVIVLEQVVIRPDLGEVQPYAFCVGTYLMSLTSSFPFSANH